MPPDEFRQHGHALVEWIARYFETIVQRPVLPGSTPGALRDALPDSAPESAEPFEDVLADLDRLIVPHATHWNHPGFFAYFAITGSGPGVLMDFVSSALNQQAMLWRTSPAATELESVMVRWLARLMHLPDAMDGVIYDTASISTLHALAAAREAAIPHVRTQGLRSGSTQQPVRVYCSDQAHSSVDKAVILLGLGHDALCRVTSDERFRMSVAALREAVARDRAADVMPIAVVATVGTTSTTSADPVAAIAEVCESEGLWLHVDAAYAGVAAMIPERRPMFAGWERADSVVINPHKWLFVPFDLSAFYTRRMDVLRQAFALVPEYLRTAEGSAGVANLMDTGVQLGRRFRALKLWMVLRTYGAEGIRALLEEHMRLARMFAAWVDADPRFERMAPTPFSVVCFRSVRRNLRPSDLDAFNERLLDAVNATGEVFLSHTRLNGAVALRLAVGHMRTTEVHVARAWELLQEKATEVAASDVG